jgi:hypothetical protein
MKKRSKNFSEVKTHDIYNLLNAWRTLAKERGITEEDVEKWIEEYRSTKTKKDWRDLSSTD